MILFLKEFFLDFDIEINLPLFKYRICHHNFDFCFNVYLVQRALKGNRGTPAFTELEGGARTALNFYFMYFIALVGIGEWHLAGRPASQPPHQIYP